MAAHNPIILNLPNHHTSKSKHPQTISPPPSIDFLKGTWHVTHSSLPLWKDKRNVTITYTPLPPTNTNKAGGTGDIPQLDDLVAYQSRDPSKPKIHTVHGVDTPSRSNPGAWDWRGKGWLVIASSHWEILGFGTQTGTEGEEGNAWVATYFAKTLFTPAGIDVYSRQKKGVKREALEGILAALRGLGAEEIGGLVDGVFEIPRD